MEAFTAEEREALAPYFTSLDGPVFALVNLPEVVKGALFARYSRSPKSLRRLFLDEFRAQSSAGGSGSTARGGAEGVTRAARVRVTSAMLTDANPMPDVTANTTVANHTSQAMTAVARRRASQSWMAVGGTARATRSLATPMARKSVPAKSVEPSVWANQPFIVMPTAASRRAATVSPCELIGRLFVDGLCGSVTCVTSAERGTVTASVTGVTGNAGGETVTLDVTGNPTVEAMGW